MNKFVKVSLAAAGIMMAVGILLCLVCKFLGGGSFIHYARNDAYMNRRIQEAEEVLEDVAERLDDTFSSEHANWFHITDQDSGTKDLKVNNGPVSDMPHEGQVQARGIRKLHLELGAGRIIINKKEAGEDTIDIYIQGKGVCDYYVDDDTFYMEGFKGVRVLNNYGNINLITMNIPKDLFCDEVEAEIGAGIMEISSLETDELSIQVGAGEVLLTDMKVDEFSTEIGAGRIEAENTQVRSANIAVSMGECIFGGSILGDLDAECDMGNIILSLAGREEDHNYELECSAGNINLGGKSTTALAAEKVINNGARSNFELSCNMGNITVDFDR